MSARLPIGEQRFRAATFAGENPDGSIRLAISSEAPAESPFGTEILAHTPDAIKLTRARDTGLALLMEHDRREQIGVVRNVRLDPDRVLRGDAYFSRSARAQEIRQDVLDGIRAGVSVGFNILQAEPLRDASGKITGYKATSWEPLEVTFAAVPADATVGVGRSLQPQQRNTMPDDDNPTPDPSGRDGERDRVTQIMNLVEASRDVEGVPAIGTHAIREGHTVDQVRTAILAAYQRTGGAEPIHVPAAEQQPGNVQVRDRDERPARILGARCRELFGEPRTRSKFETFGEFAFILSRNLDHPDLRTRAVTGAGGAGYFIPEEFTPRLLDFGMDSEIVRPRAQVFPIAGESRRIVGFIHQDASASPSKIFGIPADWSEEAKEITESVPPTKSRTLTARKLAALVEVGNESMEDAGQLGTQLETAMGTALSWHLDNAFLTGSGAGQPLGALKSPALVVVAKEAAQMADTIVLANLGKIFSRLHPASVATSVWVAHPSTIPQLLTITIGDAPLVQMGADGSLRIYTRPVLFTEKVPQLGDEGDISLMDFSQYAIGLRRDVSLERSQHVGFTRDTSHFRAIVRADGFPLWDAAYKPKGGAPTLSPFVTLAARA